MSDSERTAIGDDVRETLLDRVTSQSATVGASVPDEIEVDGTALDLSAFIVESRKVDAVPPALDRKVTAARESLETERERRVEPGGRDSVRAHDAGTDREQHDAREHSTQPASASAPHWPKPGLLAAKRQWFEPRNLGRFSKFRWFGSRITG